MEPERINGFEVLQTTGSFGCSEEISHAILRGEYGDGYEQTALIGAKTGLKSWRLKYNVLAQTLASCNPYFDGEEINPADYLWDFYCRSQAEGQPFVIQSLRNRQYYLAKFGEEKLSYELFTVRLFTTGIALQQRRIKDKSVFDLLKTDRALRVYNPNKLTLADNQEVAIFADGKTGINLTCATARPIFKENIQNENPVIRFSGTNDPLISTVDLSIRHIFIVAKGENSTIISTSEHNLLQTNSIEWKLYDLRFETALSALELNVGISKNGIKWVGDIGDIFISDKQILESDIWEIEEHLMRKWQLNVTEKIIFELPPVINLSTRINAGAGTVGRWLADIGTGGGNYFSGNSNWQENTPLRAGMAQSAVYGDLRIGTADLVYNFTALAPNGEYQIRAHCGDIDNFFEQSIEANGVEKIAQYSPQTAAGGIYKIDIKTFVANADNSGQLTITFKPKNGKQACVAALEILAPSKNFSILHAAGDSITAGGGVIAVTQTWSGQLAESLNANACTGSGGFDSFFRGYDETRELIIHTVARSDDRIDQQLTIADLQIKPLRDVKYQQETVLLTAGINDLLQGATAATIITRLTDYFNNLSNDYVKEIGTITPTTGVYSLSSGAETDRQTVNTWIRANSLGLDRIIDFAADSRLSNPGNTDYFYDGLHNTELGQSVRAELVQAII